MRKIIVFLLTLLAVTAFANGRNEHEVVLHNGGSNQGFDQIYVEPPQVTYDDDLNELYVYFGSTSTITLEYLDPNGTPYYYVYNENHVGYTSTIYTNLPVGYYTITIHSIYGYTYTGNFSVN
ncbi:MAG: hypothetical protein VZR53_05270 [Prevotella sp.]|nr:hypothetical protein [Prevotella sp.]